MDPQSHRDKLAAAIEEAHASIDVYKKAAERAEAGFVPQRNLVARSRTLLDRSRSTLGQRPRRSDTEFAHLRQADWHIARARVCIQTQRKIIANLARDGQATGLAESVLATLLNTLKAMEGHRLLIRSEVAGELISSAVPV